jgi:cell division protein FtsZ
VIATGFEHKPAAQQPQRRLVPGQSSQPQQQPAETAASENRLNNLRPFGSQPSSDQLDIPTFLRNRGRNTDK